MDILHPDLLLERLVNHIRVHPACLPDDDRLLEQVDEYLLMREYPPPVYFYKWECPNCKARVDTFSNNLVSHLFAYCPICGWMRSNDDEIDKEEFVKQWYAEE